MIFTDYCSKCKITGVPLIKYTKNKHTQYHYCRSCTTTRLKKYRQTATGKTAVRKASDRTNSKYPEKQHARQKVGYALKKGWILKSGECESCGSKDRIEGHHMDYNYPLKVSWLCKVCHAKWHRVH